MVERETLEHGDGQKIKVQPLERTMLSRSLFVHLSGRGLVRDMVWRHVC